MSARRVTALIAMAAVVALLLAFIVLGPMARWLLEDVNGVRGLQGKELAAALNGVRGTMLTLFTGLLAAVAVVFTASNAASARRSARATQRSAEAALRSAEIAEQGQLRTFALAQESHRRTVELTEQGQVTDRYTRAIEQLGADNLDVRIGGIYALERIARDSPRDHPTVVAVLAAFVREHSHDPDAHGSAGPRGRNRIRPDLQAALTVVGRRSAEHDTDRLDLGGADLTHADLAGVRMAGANLNWTDLSGANLADADLSEADLIHAKLPGADLSGANLTEANLRSADLSGARCVGADLTGTFLDAAELGGADLTGVTGPGAEQIRQRARTDEHTRL
ncbi:pentapeptide repeat-containing protein [Actinomadura sp. GC306]|uniref:pentapeptide repeat-containing protein n=1 Tax=Actinomadura sp. GC306 TaxID=2530367 RepID=UPI001049B6F6|nr:pentapeptide repeat-containing protein [Actinomadura sp. GC306]TDC64757.1 pentapeptide repeat-containing protein [Actinomadura sp. GC306]